VTGRALSVLAPTDTFVARHIGPSEPEIVSMLKVVGVSSLEGLVDTTVPKHIRLGKELVLEPARSETEALAHLDAMIGQNQLKKSFIGMGYYEVHRLKSQGEGSDQRHGRVLFSDSLNRSSEAAFKWAYLGNLTLPPTHCLLTSRRVGGVVPHLRLCVWLLMHAPPRCC
jgi:hypothetical protein